MASFATVAELGRHLDETIPDGDPRAELLLELASAAVQSYTRQRLEAVDGDELTLRGLRRRLLALPELPVRSVSSISVNGTALELEEFTWDELGLLRRRSTATWGDLEPVVVTYDHGYEVIPEPIRAVTVQAAARAFSNPESVLQEAIGNYSVTYAKAAGVELLPGERWMLDEFRHRGLA